MLAGTTLRPGQTNVPADSGAQSDTEGYRTDIDGLRAIAVMSVVLYHAGVVFLSGGYVGVDIFFVISGYLIGAHIYRDVSRHRFDLGKFYRKRAKRILPALFFVLVFCYAIALLVLTPLEITEFAKYALSTIFSFSNLVAWRDNSYFGLGSDQKPLLMTWSLGVEEQFYIVIPLVMLGFALLSRSRPRRPVMIGMSAVALLSFVLSVWGALTYRHSTFYLLPSRAWELGIGVLMAVYEAGRGKESSLYLGERWSEVRSLLGMAAIVFAIIYYGPSTPFPGAAALPPVLGAGLLLSAPGAWVNRVVLSSKPFRWVGLVSYSWYLWHWPLLSFARVSADTAIPVSKALWLCAIALGMAWVSYRFVEQPFRHSRMAVAPLLWRYATACILIALPAAAIAVTHGFPGRYPAAAAQQSALFSRKHTCMGRTSPVTSQECMPAFDGRPAIALVGDSHAEGISPVMRSLADSANMRLYTLGHPSCPPLLGVVASALRGSDAAECLAYNRAALARLAADHSAKTIVLEALWAGPREMFPAGSGFIAEGQAAPISGEESDANLKRGLEAMVSALRAAGKRVILLQDEYAFRFDAQRRIMAYLIPARGWIRRQVQGEPTTSGVATSKDIYLSENEEAARIVAQVAAEQGATTFDLRTHLCSDSTCVFYANGVPLYLDSNHLSPQGAALALQGISLVESDRATD